MKSAFARLDSGIPLMVLRRVVPGMPEFVTELESLFDAALSTRLLYDEELVQYTTLRESGASCLLACG